MKYKPWSQSNTWALDQYCIQLKRNFTLRLPTDRSFIIAVSRSWDMLFLKCLSTLLNMQLLFPTVLFYSKTQLWMPQKWEPGSQHAYGLDYTSAVGGSFTWRFSFACFRTSHPVGLCLAFWKHHSECFEHARSSKKNGLGGWETHQNYWRFIS